jgi:hypothetical protein
LLLLEGDRGLPEELLGYNPRSIKPPPKG